VGSLASVPCRAHQAKEPRALTRAGLFVLERLSLEYLCHRGRG
jgi:hypothetical protein